MLLVLILVSPGARIGVGGQNYIITICGAEDKEFLARELK